MANLATTQPGILAELTRCPATAQAITNGAAAFFEERAAIAEFDGDLAREEAEAQTRQETERHRRSRKPPRFILTQPSIEHITKSSERRKSARTSSMRSSFGGASIGAIPEAAR
jgi:hypothetical protein